jgi:hypothetical protein
VLPIPISSAILILDRRHELREWVFEAGTSGTPTRGPGSMTGSVAGPIERGQVNIPRPAAGRTIEPSTARRAQLRSSVRRRLWGSFQVSIKRVAPFRHLIIGRAPGGGPSAGLGFPLGG